MSQFQGLKRTIPQFQQYTLQPIIQQSPYSTSDRYGNCFAASQQKSKGLPCKKEKKHQNFDLIFICLEKECVNNFKPMCAQCLHEEHSGHEIKLIKEIADIANNFIQQEKRKKKISPYWEQLEDQYHKLYNQIENIITYLKTFQETLKKSNEGFYNKLNANKDNYWDTVETASSKILQEKYITEEDLYQKIRLILKNIKIDDNSNPVYRHNILKEETVLQVMDNYKEIERLVQQTKEFVMKSLDVQQIKESYQAQEVKITDGEDYLKISTVEPKSNSSGTKSSCIVEFDEDHEDQQKENGIYENFDDDDEDDLSQENERYVSKINNLGISSKDNKEKKYREKNCLNESDEFDVIEDESMKPKKEEYQEGLFSLKQIKEGRSQPNIQQNVQKARYNEMIEKPSTQEIRMKYSTEYQNSYWNQQQTPLTQPNQQHMRKKEIYSQPYDDFQPSNLEYQNSADILNRFQTNNVESIYKNTETNYQPANISQLSQLGGFSRSSRPLYPPTVNNLSMQSYINPYQKM